jgi:hypothetical protein
MTQVSIYPKLSKTLEPQYYSHIEIKTQQSNNLDGLLTFGKRIEVVHKRVMV